LQWNIHVCSDIYTETDTSAGIYTSIEFYSNSVLALSRQTRDLEKTKDNEMRCLNLLCLQIIVIAIILKQSDGQASSRKNDTDLSKLFNIFGTGIGALKFLYDSERYARQQLPDITPENGMTYDFVVIGAGTAGSTMAARLSELHDNKVLLIEAGGHENLLMNIPLLVQILQLNDNINWKYQSKPSDKYCLGMFSNRCNLPRGKIMGGSSILNYMIATRGHPKDYDRWAEMGNEGWAFKDILKYFKRMETIDIPELRSDDTYHSTEGPVHISRTRYHTPLAKGFLKAGKELGYSIQKDYNGKEMMGFSFIQITSINGTRLSSNKAYLLPKRNHKNLHLSINSLVKKILIDHDTNRTYGVKFRKYGRDISVFARKEVILCAGAIGSPQLLMLSGIGPRRHLTKLGIKVTRDAPVGENLMDHIAYGGLSWIVDAPVSLELNDIMNPSHPYIKDYLQTQSGPITIPGGCEAIAFVDIKNPEIKSGLPDIELMFFGATLLTDPLLSMIGNIKLEMSQRWQKYRNNFGWSVLPMLLKPKSRGRIRLLANDIDVKPEIITNYLDHPDDMDALIAGIRLTLNISQTKAMQAFNPRLVENVLVECSNHEYNSRAYWECALRTISFTIYHYSGTCKMGPRKDPTAVVDPELKVSF